ncbi:MAG: lytic transglycosylase domain-containing protein, partial [Flavobacterium sp.]
KKLTDREVLDSIKGSFVHDEIASCIDSLWMKELANLDLYDELTLDIKNINVDQAVEYELPTELLKERLKRLDEKSAFNIEYNVGLENVIKSFLKNRKKSFERLMGISQFYFPMFEEALAAKNIPLEIKYLAVVESALNPGAVSKMGATGLWQFMYQTGKQYNLNINTYVDERSDPLKASRAASQYMENMYKIFGDWDLVLASYNSGPGNVAKAIRRSGGKQNYWNIRKHLPQETQGYVPAFLATMYIFEYHKEHGIKPNKAIANHFATDTVMVKRAMSFKQISDLLDVPVAELQFLNPSYKRQEVPFITGENHFLRLPVDKVAIFTSNEDKIYAYVQYQADRRERPYGSMVADREAIGSGNNVVSG